MARRRTACSALILAVRITLARWSVSLAMRLPKSAGPIGIEATGYTLEEIAAHDPRWCAEVRRLIDDGRVELIVTAKPGDVIPPAGDKRPSAAMVLATGASRAEALAAAHQALALLAIETQ